MSTLIPSDALNVVGNAMKSCASFKEATCSIRSFLEIEIVGVMNPLQPRGQPEQVESLDVAFHS